MKTIALCASKGGVGKSTIAAALSVEASRRGATAVIADLDPQGSLAHWRKLREAEAPFYANTTTAKLAEGRRILAEEGADRMIIDTGPAQLATIRTAAANADLALIPVKPSPVDLAAIGPTLETVEATRTPFAFVVTMTVPRSSLTEEARAVLAEHGPVAPVAIAHRVDYARAMLAGLTAPEIGVSAAADEIAALYDFVESLI